MSTSSPAGIPRTRRELLQLTVIQLRSLASQHGLTSTGRKSALVDRLYRLWSDSSSGRERSPNLHRNRSPARTPARPRSPIADDGTALQLTVERLVERSLQGLENRLRRTLQPATTASAADATLLVLPGLPSLGVCCLLVLWGVAVCWCPLSAGAVGVAVCWCCERGRGCRLLVSDVC